MRWYLVGTRRVTWIDSVDIFHRYMDSLYTHHFLFVLGLFYCCIEHRHEIGLPMIMSWMTLENIMAIMFDDNKVISILILVIKSRESSCL